MLDERSGLLETDSAVCEHVPVIVQDWRIVGIHIEYLAELLFGEVVLLLALIDCAQHVPGGFFFARLLRDLIGLLGGLFGVGPLLSTLLNLGHVDVDFLIGVVTLQ